jgi:hypothetical protein
MRILKTSSFFSATVEVEEERKTILTQLVKLNPENSKKYEDEIREIVRNQTIQAGVREVEQSKIFVDTDAIAKWARKELKNDYARLRGLVNAGMGGDTSAFNAAVLEVLEKGVISAEVLRVPDNEAADITINLIRKIFYQCLSNPEHGLDCFLSMRIRHGTLSGQLRTPPEQERLITQKNAENSDYQTNEHWKEQLKHRVIPRDLDMITSLLKSYSKQYDDFISAVSNDKIQVVSVNKPDGLFTVRLVSTRFNLFFHDVLQNDDLDDFIDGCLKLFFESLDECLSSVRQYVNQIIKKQAQEIYNQLEIDLDKSCAGTLPAELSTAVRRARTNTNLSLDSIADWFKLPRSLDPQYFPLELMIEVGKSCVTTIYTDFTPEVSLKVPNLPPFGNSLIFFSDVFFIIFDNIRKHSGIEENPIVNITVEDFGANLTIKTTSELSDKIDIEALSTKVEAIEAKIAEQNYQKTVITEGGSGLIKLWRTVIKTNGTKNILNFGVDAQNCFFVEFTFSKVEVRL